MTVVRALVLIALGAGGAVAVDRLVLTSEPPATGGAAVARSDPAPGSPPLVWLGGTLEEIGDGSLSVREGEGARVELERASAGGTRFYRLDGEDWAVLTDRDAAAVEAGQTVCVEALLDGRNLLALRVFLGAGCVPAPG